MADWAVGQGQAGQHPARWVTDSLKMEAECSAIETLSQRGGSVVMAAKRAWWYCERVLPR